MAIRLRSRQVSCMTGSWPSSYSNRQTGNEPARTTAAVLSVTFRPCTRPRSCLALSNTPLILVPLGGLYSIVTANCPCSSTSFSLLGSRLMVSFYPPTPTRDGGGMGAPTARLDEHSFIVRVRRAREPPFSYIIPAILLADSTVLSSNIAIVIGPTPPGTGLIHPAFWLTGSKSTSPQSFPSGS